MTLGVALVVGTAGATPHGTAAIRVPAAGTFTPALGADTVSFTGTLSVERFVEVDEQLAPGGGAGHRHRWAVRAVSGHRGGGGIALGGCSWRVHGRCWHHKHPGAADFLLFVEGTTFQLGDSEATRDVCKVLKTVDNDPANQGALARALNKAFGLA